jgi:hypothetical protein
MPTEIYNNQVKWTTDRASAASTVQSNKLVGNSIADVAAKENLAVAAQQRTAATAKAGAVAFASEAEAAAKLGLSLEQLGIKADAAQQGDVTAANKQLNVERQITAEMEKQIAANDRAIRGRIGGAGNAGIATGFGGSLRAAGAAVGNIGGGQGVTQVASLIGLAELGPAAIAVGAFALGLKLVTDNAKEAATAVAASAKAYQEVREATLDRTREELELERDQAQQLIQIRQQAFDEAQAAFREAERNAAPIALLLNTDAFVEGLEATRDQSKEALTEVQNELNALNIVLADTAPLAADVAEAERQLAEIRAQFAVDEADILIRLRTSTQEERDERVRAIEDEIDILRRQADAAGKGSEAGAVFEARIISLAQELELTANSAKTYGDALERIRQKEEAVEALAEARTERNQQYLDALDREGDARDKAADIAEHIGEIVADRDERLIELQEDYSDRRAEIVGEGEERRIELAEEAADRIAKIERDRGRSSAEAVGRRDADAFRLANLRADDALEDQKAAQDKQVESTNKSLAKQLAALDKGYDKQVESAKSAASKQLATQQRQYQEQLFLAEQARASQVFLTAQGMNGVLNQTVTGWGNVEVASINALNRIANHAAAIGFGTSTGATPFPTLTSSIGAATPTINRIVDQRLNNVLILAQGGRARTQ